MTIHINDKDVELKYSYRALLMFENATGGALAPKSLEDLITFFYCTVVASSKDYTLKFDDFVDWLDDHQDAFKQFSEWTQEVNENQNKLKKD